MLLVNIGTHRSKQS